MTLQIGDYAIYNGDIQKIVDIYAGNTRSGYFAQSDKGVVIDRDVFKQISKSQYITILLKRKNEIMRELADISITINKIKDEAETKGQ